MMENHNGGYIANGKSNAPTIRRRNRYIPVNFLSLIFTNLLVIHFFTLADTTTKVSTLTNNINLVVVSGLRFYHNECPADSPNSPSSSYDCIFSNVGINGEGGDSEAASVLEDGAERQATCALSLTSKFGTNSAVITLGSHTNNAYLSQVNAFQAYYLSRLYVQPKLISLLSLGNLDMYNSNNGKEKKEEGATQILIDTVLDNKRYENIDWVKQKKTGSLSYRVPIGDSNILVMHDSINAKNLKVKQSQYKWTLPIIWLKQMMARYENIILVMQNFLKIQAEAKIDKELSQLVSRKVVAIIVALPVPWSATPQWKPTKTSKQIPVYVAASVHTDCVMKITLDTNTLKTRATIFNSGEGESCAEK